MKKNNSLKLFNKLAKRAYKVSKKRKLGWKWSDAQKWTSANLFKKYKGTKNLSKVKVTEIDIQVKGILDGALTPIASPLIMKSKQNCFSPFAIASSFLDSFEWFDIVDKVGDLNDDVNVDLDLEYNGNVFSKTGVIKKEFLPNLLGVREDMRKVSSKSGFYPIVSFYIALIEGAEDNREMPCNYYILITFEGSSTYNALKSKGLIKDNFTSKEQMPVTEIERLALKQKQRDEERKSLSQKTAKTFQLPSKVEPKTAPVIKDSKANRLSEYNKAMDKLDSQLERKLITKKQYNERFQQLGKNLKDGGAI